MKYQATSTIIITGFHTLASDTSIMHQMPGPSRSSQLQYCSPLACPSPPSPPTDEIRFQSIVASKWVQTSGTASFPPTNAHNHRHERARVEAQAHVPGEAGFGYRLTSTRICAGCSEAWNRITAQRKAHHSACDVCQWLKLCVRMPSRYECTAGSGHRRARAESEKSDGC